MKNVNVRSFVDGDERDVAFVHNAAFREWVESLGGEYDYHYVTSEEVSAWIKGSYASQECLWIAEMNDRAVGYAHCCLNEVHARRDFKELLFVPTSREMGQSRIAVIPQCRRQGIATALVQKCLEHFESMGANLTVAITYSDNKVANKLLHGLGFVHHELFYYQPYSDENLWRHDTIYAELDLSQPVKPPQRLNQNVIVRKAKEEDAKPIASIFRKSAPWTPFGPDASTDQILQHYLKSESPDIILVAEYEEEIVGVMDFNSNNNRLGIPGVLPEYRKKGIGYTLFYYLLERMREEGLSKAIADTGFILSNAIRMYNQFNFKIVRKQCSWNKVLNDGS